MRVTLARALPFVFIAVAFLLSALAWPHLGERMPVHWGITGEPDRWGSRTEGTLMLPAMLVGLVLLMRFLPRIDPRRENFAKMRGVYDFVIAVVAALMLGIHSLVLAAGLGHRVPVDTIIPVFIGVMLILLGNVLPRSRSNWWFGIRTPWTLSSDRVWARTHRVAGFCFVAAGLILILAPILPGVLKPYLIVGTVLVGALIPVVYSYFAWRSEPSVDAGARGDSATGGSNDLEP
jgi:uncharacterized membrane protein